MKKLILAIGVIAATGCSSVITTPQNISGKSELARQYVAYQHQLQGPSIEVLSYFDVQDAIISKEGDIVLTGRFKIANEHYRTDTQAEMEFGVTFNNLGNDRIAISDAELKAVDLNSVHLPIDSDVNQAAKLHGKKIAQEMNGKIVTGQDKLAVFNKVNETFRLGN